MYSAFMYHSKHQYMCITSPLLIALFLNNDIAVSSAKLSVVASVKMSVVLTSATGGDEGGGVLDGLPISRRCRKRQPASRALHNEGVGSCRRLVGSKEGRSYGKVMVSRYFCLETAIFYYLFCI